MRKFLLGLVAVLAVGAPIAMAAPARAETVKPSKPNITKFNASPTDFYPTVRDGYRDGVSFNGHGDRVFTLNPDYDGDWWDDEYTEVGQSYTITVRNDNAVKVYERSGRSNDVWGNWNGKSQRTDEPVRVGLYKATLVMTNNNTGETDSSTIRLHARSDTVDRRKTQSRSGTNTSSRSHSGSCYFNGFYGSLDLDCWGGRQAIANYGFTVPRNARNLTWNVRGDRGCCDNGQVVKTGTRTGDHFNVRVRVTNWAAYTVNRASVTYTTAVRR